MIGYDLYADTQTTITIPAGQIISILTGIAIQCPTGTYARIALYRKLCIKNNLTTEGGIIDPGYRGNITILLRNVGAVNKVINPKERIAQLILEQAVMAL